MKHFSQEAILEIHTAALKGGLDRVALLVGLDVGLVSQLKELRAPGPQILHDLNVLNQIEGLLDNSVPMATWLATAHQLSTPRVESVVFAKYLNALTPRTPPAPEATTPPVAPPGPPTPDPLISIGRSGMPGTTGPRKVFISYKHGTAAENEWVKQLATDLIEIYGIDCILDQFDLGPGESIHAFMQKIKTDATDVLFVITPRAVAAVESSTGGLSFEASLWAALRAQGRLRVIPILQKGDQSASYVEDHLYLDFRDASRYESRVKQLADALLGKRIRPEPGVRVHRRFHLLSPAEKIDLLRGLAGSSDLSLLSRALHDPAPNVAGAAWRLLRDACGEAGRRELEGHIPRGMVPIPAGPFVMGENDNAHIVTLGPYYIDRFPVTNAEYAIFVRETRGPPPHYWRGEEPPKILADHPVVYVTWYDASNYASWVGKRLPTDAEWEKAASWAPDVGRKRAFPWGDEWRSGCCNQEETGTGDTAPVGAHSPAGDSAYGLAETVGHVREWTSSLYRPFPYDPADNRDDPTLEGRRVVRGGGWNRLLRWGRSGIVPLRGAMPNSFYRFRCALSP